MNLYKRDGATRLLRRFDTKYKGHAHIVDCSEEENLPIDFLVDMAKAFNDHRVVNMTDFDDYSIDSIIHYLKKTHEHYLAVLFPEIREEIRKLEATGSFAHLAHVLADFLICFELDLIEHFELEENVLFPYACRLENVKTELEFMVFNSFEAFSLSEFVQMHDHLDAELNELRMVLRRKANSQDSAISRVLEKLRSFETDLYIHEYLEESVLVPRLNRIYKYWSDERITR